jgi:hypothetical protein
MRHRGCAAIGIAAVALAALIAPQRSAAQPDLRAGSLARWAELDGVSVAPRSTTVWAYGYHTPAEVERAYVIRRSGATWHHVSVPQSANGGAVRAIAATSAHSAYLVGNRGSDPLVLHSSGGVFNVVNTGLGVAELATVAASSPSNVWIAGEDPIALEPVVIHRTRAGWQRVHLDRKVPGMTFVASATTGPSNVWLVGRARYVGPAIVEHWNGHRFARSRIDLPKDTVITGAASASPRDAWIVGYWPDPDSQLARPLTFHWNGHKWTSVPVTTSYPSVAVESVASVGRRTYSAGAGYPSTSGGEEAVVMRFVHHHWQLERAETPGTQSSLGDISISSKATAAVGGCMGGPQCGPDSGSPTPVFEAAHGTSWWYEVTPF